MEQDQTQTNIKATTTPKEFIIQHALRNRLNTGRADIFTPNANVYEWESDLLQITKARFVHEYEIKCSRADLLNDVKSKVEKHRGLKDGKYTNRMRKYWVDMRENILSGKKTYNSLKQCEDQLLKHPEFLPVPNYFWYVIVGFTNYKPEELPEYAGIIVMDLPDTTYPYARLEFIRGAPRLHKNKLTDKDMIKALQSIQYRFWDLHSRKYL
jgi:hypothetical protein